MAMFEHAHRFTAAWEGGLVDHPADPGGITKYGVSLRWLRSLGHSVGHSVGDIDGDGDIDADDVRALSAAQAAHLFQEAFWQSAKLDTLPQNTATVQYDCMVNTGPTQAARIAQRACNTLLQAGDIRLTEDGLFGPRTRNFLIRHAHAELVGALIEERMRFYRDLVRKKPTFAPFEKGWLNRCMALRDYVRSI